MTTIIGFTRLEHDLCFNPADECEYICPDCGCEMTEDEIQGVDSVCEDCNVSFVDDGK